MAIASFSLIEALRKTAYRLQNGAYYQWSHQGSCNCGHLAQTITRLSKAEIHKIALEKEGNWEEKSIEYCKTSGYTIDHVIESMLNLGLTTNDIANLEKLSCPKILNYISPENKSPGTGSLLVKLPKGPTPGQSPGPKEFGSNPEAEPRGIINTNKPLARNNKEDVILYMLAWADMLEAELTIINSNIKEKINEVFASSEKLKTANK